MSTLEAYRQAVKDFLKQDFLDQYENLIASKELLKKTWHKAGQLGFFRGGTSEEYGGFGDLNYNQIILEELGNAYVMDCPLWLQASIVPNFFSQYGSPEQKEAYLPRIMSGEILGAVAMSEAHSGSNVEAFVTNATTTEDGYILNGGKKYIGCGSIADFYLVVSHIDNSKNNSLLVVDRNCPGVTVTSLPHQDSLRALDLAEITFDNVHLPKEALLKKAKNASIPILRTLSIERYSGSYIAHVLSQGLLKAGVQWAKNRASGEGSIYDHQYIQFKFADFYSNIRANDAFMKELSTQFLNGKQISVTDAAIAKHKVITELIAFTTFLSQLFGATSIVADNNVPVLKLLNDAIAQSIAGGTDEIMKIIIAKSL